MLRVAMAALEPDGEAVGQRDGSADRVDDVDERSGRVGRRHPVVAREGELHERSRQA